MAKTKKSQTSNSKPKTSGKITKITKAKKLVSKNVKVTSRSKTRKTPLKFGDLHQSDLESKIVWEVLSNFTLAQQLKMRTISPVWDYNVQLACKHICSLELHFTKPIIPDPNNKPDLNIREHFIRYLVKISKQFSMSNKMKFTIKSKQWKRSTNAALGKLFSNVEQLTIRHTVDNDNNELLFNLLRYFPKVTEFSMIILNKITKCNENFVTKLFAAIADHLAPLASLHLYFESNHFPKVNVSKLSKILPFLQNLSLCFPAENYPEIIEMMVKNRQPQFPMQSLCFRASSLKVSQIKQMFKDNPQLVKMTRLKLVDVNDRELVDCLLDHFTELECLEISLGSQLNAKNDYSVEWTKTFSKLTHLTELAMYGMHPRNFNQQVPKALSTIRRLTFGYTDFLNSICKDFAKGELTKTLSIGQIVDQMLHEFVVSFAEQYPNLEELTYGCIHLNYRCKLANFLKAHYGNLKPSAMIPKICYMNDL